MVTRRSGKFVGSSEIEVTVEGIMEGTGTESDGKRIPDLWGCNSESVRTKYSANKRNGL